MRAGPPRAAGPGPTRAADRRTTQQSARASAGPRRRRAPPLAATAVRADTAAAAAAPPGSRRDRAARDSWLIGGGLCGLGARVALHHRAGRDRQPREVIEVKMVGHRREERGDRER